MMVSSTLLWEVNHEAHTNTEEVNKKARHTLGCAKKKLYIHARSHSKQTGIASMSKHESSSLRKTAVPVTKTAQRTLKYTIP